MFAPTAARAGGGLALTRRDHRFSVRHRERQRLLLLALEQMKITAETLEQSRLITEMIVELERLLSSRVRGGQRRSYRRSAFIVRLRA